MQWPYFTVTLLYSDLIRQMTLFHSDLIIQMTLFHSDLIIQMTLLHSDLIRQWPYYTVTLSDRFYCINQYSPKSLFVHVNFILFVFALGYSIVNMGQLLSNQYKAIPLHLIDWDIHIRPCGLKVQFSACGLPWRNSSKFPSHHVISCDPLGSTEQHKLFRFCANVKREASEHIMQNSNQFSSFIIALVAPFCVVNLLPCEMCLSLCSSHKSDTDKQGNIVKKGKSISFYEVI